jgi:hypothetical protein
MIEFKAVLDHSKDQIFEDLDKSVKDAHEIKLEPDEQNALETWRAQCADDPKNELDFILE